MIDIKCVDSSVWISYYLTDSGEIKAIIESDCLLVTSSLCFFEAKKRLVALKKDPEELLTFMRERSKIILPTPEIAMQAASISIEKKLAAMDALMYATSQWCKAELLTTDNDFRGLSQVIIFS